MSGKAFASRRVLAAAILFCCAAESGRAGDVRILPSTVGLSELFASDRASGLALGGWDPVSYQLGGAPQPGSARVQAVWGGLAWRFASEANRAAFLADPEAFAPRLGGYDGVAVVAGVAVDADPSVYAVLDGHLYLFRTPERRARFLAAPSLPETAERRWAALRETLVRS